MAYFTHYLAIFVALSSHALAAGIPPNAVRQVAPRQGAFSTKTVVRTISQESTAYFPFGLTPLTWTRYLTTGSVTRLEPIATSYPAKVTVEEKTVVTVLTTMTASTYSTEVRSAQSTWIDTQTWALLRPQPTDVLSLIPAGAELLGAVACASCLPATAAPDPECERLGLRTGCDAAQCPRAEDGTYWCREMYPGMYSSPGYRNGRACWGNGTEYKQLLKPCRVGDGIVGCTACKGDLGDFYPKNWH